MKAFVERMLAKVFAQKAHEPSLDTMTSYERHEAEMVAAKPDGMRSRLVDSSGTARYDAEDAMAPRHVPMASELIDDSDAARAHAEAASAHDGSHLHSKPVDHSEAALADIRDASHHEAPRSRLVDNTEEARYAAQRASEPSRAGDADADEAAEKRD